ncbi:hsp70 nucleotide exchange factor fes1 [Podochytrium sp. JEL0797]|nr:hsp70 nucleotide exchange factor fes1 [Podochytrium sp. JEL0797]
MSAVDEKDGKFVSKPVTASDLLQWAVINKATKEEDAPARTEPMEPREPIDPKWIDIILGKPDSVRMKECIVIIQDSTQSLEVKLQAFDELEMLVESLDNANNLRGIGLWRPIVDVLKSDPEAELRTFAAWVISTAVQNNPQAQQDFLEMGGLPILLHQLDHDTDPEVRAKCVTCLSGVVRQNPKAYEMLRAASPAGAESFLGLAPVLELLKDESGHFVKAKKRAIFFLDSLVSGSSGEEAAVYASAIEDAETADWAGYVVELLKRDQDLHCDFVEKCLEFLVHLNAHPSVVSPSVKAALKELLPPVIKKFDATGELDETVANTCKIMFCM